jgi:ribosomal protein S18 acetylase RimI-like enzyme
LKLADRKIGKARIAGAEKLAGKGIYEGDVAKEIQGGVEGFARLNRDDVGKVVDDIAKEQLSKEIEQEHSAFYFAKLENTVIGYLKINYSGAQTELNDQKSLELERIYIGKEYYGKGVGQLLLNFALQIAKQQQMDYVWLGVWEENHRAIQFYLKNGFITFDKHVFMLGDEAQTDFMMKLELKNIE